jgi:hypothetical protein
MGATVTIAGGELVVRITGRDRFWALSGGITVPLSGVHKASVVGRRDASVSSSYLRLPGTYLPGVIRAGSYGFGKRRELWCVRRAERLLVIELTGRRYRRVVVEVVDPDQVAESINRVVSGGG